MNKELRRGSSSQADCSSYKNLTRSIPASIRFITPRDFKQIAIIEYDSFEYPWLNCDFRSKLDEDGTICYVVEHNGFIVAYAIIQYFPHHIELCNIAVDRDYRNNKIASLIINMLKIKLHLENRNCITAIVSERNLLAQHFLYKRGFLAKKVMNDYYAKDHDAYYMVFEIDEQI